MLRHSKIMKHHKKKNLKRNKRLYHLHGNRRCFPNLQIICVTFLAYFCLMDLIIELHRLMYLFLFADIRLSDTSLTYVIASIWLVSKSFFKLCMAAVHLAAFSIAVGSFAWQLSIALCCSSEECWESHTCLGVGWQSLGQNGDASSHIHLSYWK